MAQLPPDVSWSDAVDDFIKSVGVPAAALFWLLYRTDKRLERVAERIDELTKKALELASIADDELADRTSESPDCRTSFPDKRFAVSLAAIG